MRCSNSAAGRKGPPRKEPTLGISRGCGFLQQEPTPHPHPSAFSCSGWKNPWAPSEPFFPAAKAGQGLRGRKGAGALRGPTASAALPAPPWQGGAGSAGKGPGAAGCALRAPGRELGLPWGSLPAAGSGHSHPARVQDGSRSRTGSPGWGGWPCPQGAARAVPSAGFTSSGGSVDSVHSTPRCSRAIKSIKSTRAVPARAQGALGARRPRAEGEHHPSSCAGSAELGGHRAARQRGPRAGPGSCCPAGAAAGSWPGSARAALPRGLFKAAPAPSVPNPRGWDGRAEGAGAGRAAGIRGRCQRMQEMPGDAGAVPRDAEVMSGGCQRCCRGAGAVSREPRGCQVTLGVPGGCRGDDRFLFYCSVNSFLSSQPPKAQQKPHHTDPTQTKLQFYFECSLLAIPGESPNRL